MPFKDRYTNFWYNDISSESMHVWITNNKDLAFKGTPTFSDTFVSPANAQGRYHTATSMTNTDISLKCIAINVNMLEWRAIQNWLSPLTKGRLQFDFNNNTYYEVKVSKPINGVSFINGADALSYEDSYNIEFSIDFTTTNDWAALGTSVTVPLHKSFQDKEKVNLVIMSDVPSTELDLQSAQIELKITYSQAVEDQDKWFEPTWWTENIASIGADYTNVLQALTDHGEEVAYCLGMNLKNQDFYFLSDAINNKFCMPIVYDMSLSRNLTDPRPNSIALHDNRKYLTEPTMIHNQIIYFDKALYEEHLEAGDVEYNTFNYYFLDNVIEAKNTLTDAIDYTNLQNNYTSYIAQQTTLGGTTELAFCQRSGQDSYTFNYFGPITEDGLAFFGTPVLFTCSSDVGYANSPFYILDTRDTYAVMNAGSYDQYPDLFVGLGRGTNVSVSKDKELLYDYDLSITNASLQFNGKTGFVLFNNTLAEAANLTAGEAATKVVKKSINNGTLAIPPGNPELLKIRIFKVTDTYLENPNGEEEDPESLHIKHIYFQPVGDFKYARNNPFASLIFESVSQEQPYNTGTYPLVRRDYFTSSAYGSTVHQHGFSVNGFLTQAQVSQDIKMWVLTVPEKDLSSSFIEHISSGDKYMFLSLCDYTEMSISSDNSGFSFITTQTRDAY